MILLIQISNLACGSIKECINGPEVQLFFKPNIKMAKKYDLIAANYCMNM